MVKANKSSSNKKNTNLKFNIDCAQPVEDGVLVTSDFKDFLLKRVKVEGKTGNLGDDVAVTSDKTKILVTSQIPFSKRYLSNADI
jgi:large subunit ribosomal protein L22e